MSTDSFGDLRDWGRVIGRIGELRDSGQLDRDQDELVRVLRFPQNWQLREAALKAAADLKAPGETVIRQLLRLLDDETLYYEARMLAASALGRLLGRLGAPSKNGPAMVLKAIGSMERILESPLPPVLQDSIRAVVAECREERRIHDCAPAAN